MTDDVEQVARPCFTLVLKTAKDDHVPLRSEDAFCFFEPRSSPLTVIWKPVPVCDTNVVWRITDDQLDRFVRERLEEIAAVP